MLLEVLVACVVLVLVGLFIWKGGNGSGTTADANSGPGAPRKQEEHPSKPPERTIEDDRTRHQPQNTTEAGGKDNREQKRIEDTITKTEVNGKDQREPIAPEEPRDKQVEGKEERAEKTSVQVETATQNEQTSSPKNSIENDSAQKPHQEHSSDPTEKSANIAEGNNESEATPSPPSSPVPTISVSQVQSENSN